VPDSNVIWAVSVTNKGNVDDVYDLSVSEFVRDNTSVYPKWGAALDNTQLFIRRGESRITMLRATVPKHAKTCIWNTLTVTATSRSDNSIVDSDSRDVHVLRLKPRTHRAGIKILVEAEVLAVEVQPSIWDFGLMSETEVKQTDNGAFTIKNVGNKPIDVTIEGADAVSKDGEPVTRWKLSDSGEVGIDVYAMWYRTDDWRVLSKSPSVVARDLPPGGEKVFDLKIQAPRTISTPAKMWTKVVVEVMRA
jgi:hypothetical protein